MPSKSEDFIFVVLLFRSELLVSDLYSFSITDLTTINHELAVRVTVTCILKKSQLLKPIYKIGV